MIKAPNIRENEYWEPLCFRYVNWLDLLNKLNLLANLLNLFFFPLIELGLLGVKEVVTICIDGHD